MGIQRFMRVVICILCLLLEISQPLHITGKWNSRHFFKFVSKFAFQQTDLHNKIDTQGYIYGNITSSSALPPGLTFIILDSVYFLEFYGNRTVQPRATACQRMFNKIERIAYDYKCNPNGKIDLLRGIPCPKNQLCVEETDPDSLVPGYQFTYFVQDIKQPRYWYISIVACSHNASDSASCWWQYDPQQVIELDLDIWLVNGNPFTKHVNPFEHQFSFEMHDVFEIYFVFLILYTLLIPVQIYAVHRQQHTLPMLLLACMLMEYIGIIANFIHIFKFAFDGQGFDLLKVVGNFIDQTSQCIFMLLLMLIAKGWTITSSTLSNTSWMVLMSVWATYTMANMALFIWNQMEVDFLSDVGEWQTWPGYLILIFRLALMIWFLLELQSTVKSERSREKNQLYLHFGAGYLVWFVYLPILALIGSKVSALWRYKTMLSVTYGADIVYYAVLIHLLWPSRSYMYFNLRKEGGRISLDDFEFSGLSRDFDYESDESVDIYETSTLLRQSSEESQRDLSKHSKVEQSNRCGDESHRLGDENGIDEKVDDIEEELDNLADAEHLPLIVGTEHCDSGIESLANGEQIHR